MNPVVQSAHADIGNWRGAPHRAWAFHHIDDILRVDRIAGSDAPPALIEAAADFSAFEVDAADGTGLDLGGFLEATSTDGIVVLKHGRVVLEYYAHGMAADTRHILMSASKAVVGLVAGILTATGALDPDALVSAYVPEIAATGYAGATVRHLLDMRAGIVFDPAQQRAYEASTGWEPAPADAPGLHAFLAGLPDTPTTHGGAFRYVSANTDLLGWVIERAGGRPFAALASDLLWRPLGAAYDAFVTIDRAGAPRTTGGLCTTVRDLARLGQLMVEGGHGVVPASWIDDLAIGGDRDAWRTGEWGALFPLPDMAHRSGWYAVGGDAPYLFAMGIHGQNLFVDRASGLVIAKLSSQDWFDVPAVRLTHRAVAAFRRCLG